MYQFVSIIHVLAAVSIILLVLVQQGKGATTGAAFGSGASQTVFGSRGSGSFLLRVTIGFAVIFFATSVTLNRLATNASKQVTHIELPALPAAPASDAPTSNTQDMTPSNIPAAPAAASVPVSVTPSNIPAAPADKPVEEKPAGEKQ